MEPGNPPIIIGSGIDNPRQLLSIILGSDATIPYIIKWGDKMKILVVEDEELLAQSLRTVLESEGYEADTVGDGEMGELYGSMGIYDLIIMDVMMPRLNGCQVAQHLRAKHIGTPILMLTAKSALEDRITGLNAGADYYLPKPFDIRELLACVSALLRRQGCQVNEVSFGNTRLDLDRAMLTAEKGEVQLSNKEFEILRFLFQNGEKNLPKDLIIEKVWGFDTPTSENSVEVYMGFLRKKLARIGSDIRIRAIRNLGYHLEAES